MPDAETKEIDPNEKAKSRIDRCFILYEKMRWMIIVLFYIATTVLLYLILKTYHLPGTTDLGVNIRIINAIASFGISSLLWILIILIPIFVRCIRRRRSRSRISFEKTTSNNSFFKIVDIEEESVFDKFVLQDIEDKSTSTM